MLAAWLGVRRPRPQAARTPGDPAAMLRELGPGAGIGLGGDVHAGLGGAAVLDFAALKKVLRRG
jgi:hypothetical protein